MKLKKLLLSLTVGISLIFSSGLTAFAYQTFNDHVLYKGVGNYGNNNRCYYITSSASGFSSRIVDAMNSWIYTTSSIGVTTPISFVQTSTQTDSVMDVYAGIYKNYPYNNANAFTELWVYSYIVDQYSQDWVWGKIFINAFNTNTSISNSKVNGIIAHEMGHCMGLAENNTNKYSIMCQEASGRAVTNPQSDDLYGINHLY